MKEKLMPIDLQSSNLNKPITSMSNFYFTSPEAGILEIDISKPEVFYDGPMPGRDSSELLSHIISLNIPCGRVLDLGCGPRDQAECFNYLKYEYIGIDVPGSNADVIGDAHFLPFQEAQFDIVFSYAVLEHLYNPFLALSEIRRVLKPGGVFVGTVSMGEPFHSSFFHLTPWALLSLCDSSDLKLMRLWAGPDTLTSLASMGRYPKIIRVILSVVDRLHRSLPILAPRRSRWSEHEKRVDELYRAGSLCFSIQKPE